MGARTAKKKSPKVRQYVARLSHEGSLEPGAETLRALHLAHLRQVPFENLDVHLGRPIALDVAHSFAKVVSARRGGYCYELNGLFGWLLRQLGFAVSYLSAGVVRPDGSFGPEFDHLALLVRVPGASPQGGSEPAWLADVGFGDSFLEPLPLVPGEVFRQASRSYRLDEQGDLIYLCRLDESDQWQYQYRFTLPERDLRDFAAMNRHHQSSPESVFTQRCLATIATDGGRTTVANLRLVMTRNGVKFESPIADAGSYARALFQHFGISLPQTDIARLTTRLAERT